MSAQRASGQLAFLKAVGLGRHRRGAGRRMRGIVGKRDIAQFGTLACFCCGLPVSINSATLEHIQSKASGGTFTLANLALSHPLCNELRGDSNSPRAAIAQATGGAS